MSSDSPQVISYSTEKPPRISRRAVFLVLTTLALCLIAWFLLNNRATIRLYLLQKRALSSGPPPNTLVFHDSAPQLASHKPEVARSSESLPLFIGNQWANLIARSTIFIGHMATPNGTDQVVVIEFAKGFGHADRSAGGLAVSVQAFAPADWFRPPSGFVREAANVDAFKSVKVYGGAIDSDDRSHVTFDLEFDGARITYDVWLRDPARGFKTSRIVIQRRW
jgi:hypothetical protein